MKCPSGKRFLRSVADTNVLEQRLDSSLSDIRRLLSRECVHLLSNRPYTLTALGGIRFVIENRVFEVAKRIWHLNFPQYRSAHGIYRNGKIFLKEENWCQKTLYHEALHAASSFMMPDIYRLVGTQLFMREGITEFLTGYLLFKERPECYDAWKRRTYEECRISYRPNTKLWCAFCHFIDLEVIPKLYFWDGTTGWSARYSRFLNAIHQAGYADFRDVLALEGNSEVLFTQECISNFGEDFEEILSSRQSLEYEHIRE